MKKSIFAFVSILLVLMVLVSSFAMIGTSAEKIDNNYVWSEETPFIMYEDEKGIRYIGPTGDTSLENYQEEKPVNTEPAENEKTSRKNNELAAVGNNVLPSQVDLSTSKYFPAIGSQGSLGSCATWATVYYQFTYEMNRMRGTTATPENTAAPNFVYNLLSQKDASGTSAEENYAVLKSQGVPPITLLPYNDKEYLSWNAEEKIWREAMNWRLEDYKDLEFIGRDGKEITSPTDPDLDEIKTALSNEQIVTFSSYMNSWVFDTLDTHPDAPENAKYDGEKIVKYLDGIKGSHRMVIVGYNDEIWFDHNSNNMVDDGEKGAFKIANSWGTSFGNKGFCWVSYDALNYQTSVDGGYSEDDRVGCMSGFTTITVRPYKEGTGIYLKFTLNTSDRTQISLKVTTEHNGTTEHSWFLKDIYFSKPDNAFSFGGKTVAEDGTFCFPLDNVSPELNSESFDEYNFSVTIKDTKTDSIPLIVKNLELVNDHEGKTYKYTGSQPVLNGTEQTFDIKACDTDNKTIYYIGYDEPTLHYRENGIWKEAQMEKNEEHLGHNYKYVIQDIPEDTYLYFTDQNGNTDDNSGSYYVAKDRLNYFRTFDVRDELVLKDFILDPESTIDVCTNRYLIADATGGYEPYYYQYTIEHVESGMVAVEKFRTTNNAMHYFNKAGQFKITAEVKDQSGDIASLTKFVTATDVPFMFEELTATGENGGNLFVGDNINFFARTKYEKIMYMRTTYDFVIKDSKGNVCLETSVKPTNCSTNFGYSLIDLYWTPAKKGDYTITVSETDANNEYAEKTLNFTVLDKIYGDANGDGEVNVKDATAIQKYLVGIKQDFVFMEKLADCDVNEIVTIKDATCIRKFIANVENSYEAGKYVDYIPPETEPGTSEVTEPETEPKPVGNNQVTFTNSHKWSGTVYCYYWSDSNKNMTSWPGVAMKNAGTNNFGETYYTFSVPTGVTYVIFTNGSAQTVDIPYSGGDVKFYPLGETDSSGHYKVANW